jgi:VWFA-related protein
MRTPLAAVLFAAIVATGGHGPSAQSPQPPPPTFRGGVDVVQADALVLDTNGRQVRGLTSADFTLSVDGQPRAIDSVDYIAAGMASDAAARAAQLSAPSSADRAAPPTRHVVFVVDQGNIGAGRGRAAISAASRMLDRFGPRDRLALLSIPTGPSVDFTADREAIRTGLTRIVGRAPSAASADDFRLSLTDLFMFDLGATAGDRSAQESILLRECPETSPKRELCVHALRAEVATRLGAIREGTRDTTGTLEKLVQSLGTMTGPKAVVLISEGLPLRPDHREDAPVTSLGARAAVAGVKLFVMLLDGSVIDVADSAGRERPSSTTLSQDRWIEEDGLRTLAATSGGVLLRASGNGAGAIDRLADALAGYYVIGFRVLPADREGAHRISIGTTRPSLTVVARAQFAIPAAARRPATSSTAERASVERRASRRPETISSVSIDKVRLRVATHSVADTDGTVRVLLSIDVQDPAATPVTALALGYKLTAGDRIVADTGRVVPVVRDSTGGAQPINYFAFRNLPPGRYSLQLSASDGTKHSGFVTHPVDAALHRLGPYTAGDLLLATTASSEQGPFAVPADVIAARQLIAGVEVTAPEQSALSDALVRFEIIDAQGAVRATSDVALASGGPLSQFVRATIDVSLLPKGDYVARASIITGGIAGGVAAGSLDAAFRVSR